MRHQLQLPTVARILFARAILARGGFLFVLGAGDPARDPLWDGANPPVPPLGATTVAAPFARIRPAAQGFAVPDEAGVIRADGVRYRQSAEATRYLWFRLDVDGGDFVDAELREIGLFAEAVIAPGVPAGQSVIDPGSVIAPGTLAIHDFVERTVLVADETLDRDFVLRI